MLRVNKMVGVLGSPFGDWEQSRHGRSSSRLDRLRESVVYTSASEGNQDWPNSESSSCSGHFPVPRKHHRSSRRGLFRSHQVEDEGGSCSLVREESNNRQNVLVSTR